MNMPDMKSMKKSLKGVNDLQLCTSMDAAMKIKRKNEMNSIKSFAIHKSCKIPILKAALIILGVMMAIWAFTSAKKKMTDE